MAGSMLPVERLNRHPDVVLGECGQDQQVRHAAPNPTCQPAIDPTITPKYSLGTRAVINEPESHQRVRRPAVFRCGFRAGSRSVP